MRTWGKLYDMIHAMEADTPDDVVYVPGICAIPGDAQNWPGGYRVHQGQTSSMIAKLSRNRNSRGAPAN